MEQNLEDLPKFNLDDKKIRKNFIKKVYSIIFLQLLFTSVIIGFTYNLGETFKTFYKNHYYIAIIAIVLEIITMYALSCYIHIARKVPLNYTLLIIFTLCFSYLLSYFVVQFEPKNVIIASVLTTAITWGLTFYAFYTKTDFTICGGVLFGMSLGLIAGSILLFFFRNHVLYIILLWFGLILYCIYLVYDTQLLLKNKANILTVDDYIFASLNLYIDIVQIFVYILSLLGKD